MPSNTLNRKTSDAILTPTSRRRLRGSAPRATGTSVMSASTSTLILTLILTSILTSISSWASRFPAPSVVEAASPRLEGIACRSVHLRYRAPRAAAFYNEVTVRRSHEGTYFCVCGFHMGYFGLQELSNGRKVLIFSVWDPGRQNDPDAVDAEERVQLLHRGEGVRIGRFGNEGTGGQSFYDFDWRVDQTYRFLVTARAEGEGRERRVGFAAYFYLPDERKWKHLVTFRRKADHGDLRGYYSFVEDFRRNRVSATQTRTAEFGNAWVRGGDGEWFSIREAQFTGDGNPVMNIDGGLAADRFFLSTGGEIANDGTPLNGTIKIERRSAPSPPDDLPTDDLPPDERR